MPQAQASQAQVLWAPGAQVRTRVRTRARVVERRPAAAWRAA